MGTWVVAQAQSAVKGHTGPWSFGSGNITVNRNKNLGS